MDLQLLNLINIAYLTAFIALLLLAIVRIGRRAFEYRKEKISIPLILKRDFFFLTGLATPFLGVLVFRALGIIASQQPWYVFWVLSSNTFAILGTLFWVYVEYFKIEKK